MILKKPQLTIFLITTTLFILTILISENLFLDYRQNKF